MAAAAFLAVWFGLAYLIAYLVTAPRNEPIPDRAEIGGAPVDNVSFAANDGLALSAWLAKANPERAVVLMAGIGANRRVMLERGAYYVQLGFSPLLLDLRGTGASGRATVTIGWEERRDVLAAIQFLRERGFKTVGVHGISLGAAAILYAAQDGCAADFAVLESPYDTLDHAWRNRLAIYHVPPPITFAVRWFVQQRIGVDVDRLAPLNYASRLTMPVLHFAGDAEPELKPEETQAIFNALGTQDKRLHWFKGGRHYNFMSHHREEFCAVLREFLAAHFPTAAEAVQQAA
jgi:alpha-beta hydrolase superfamily lysophospholipase